MRKRGGVDLEDLNVSHNRLGGKGFAEINNQLIIPWQHLKTLDVSFNYIEKVALTAVHEAVGEKIYGVTILRLDGNPFKPFSIYKLA